MTTEWRAYAYHNHAGGTVHLRGRAGIGAGNVSVSAMNGKTPGGGGGRAVLAPSLTVSSALVDGSTADGASAAG